MADIVLVGSAPRGRALLRSTAQPGDCIYVTGHLGGAAAELALLQKNPKRFARVCDENANAHDLLETRAVQHPHLFPQPRLAVGQALLQRLWATAAIDISDGLSTDLDHLCEESGVCAEIEAARLPVHPLAAARPDALALALHGGEDYELLFTAAATTRVPRSIAGVPVARIGQILPQRKGSQPRMLILCADAKRPTPLHATGWEHYRE